MPCGLVSKVEKFHALRAISPLRCFKPVNIETLKQVPTAHETSGMSRVKHFKF